MKRCPECYESYDDQEKFCEADGHALLTDPTVASKREVVIAPAAPAVWWPAAAFGVLIGIVFGAGVFVAVSLYSTPEARDLPSAVTTSEIRDKSIPNHAAKSNPIPAIEPEASPSPDAELEAETEPSPVANPENKTASAELNHGPISTGPKKDPDESDGGIRTVIEMNDGSTLDVDAAWEDKQGIWYRRSGLVSFVESSRVKAITTARRETKIADNPQR